MVAGLQSKLNEIMNIVSTFMFSEPHEADLLFLKLTIEDPFVVEWVIVENSFTFQGDEKKLCLEEILSESKFDPFRHKIHIIAVTRNYSFEYEPSFKLLLKRRIKRFLNKQAKSDKYTFVPYAELAAFHCEINQRQIVEDYISNKFEMSDIVFPGDTDEILDLSENKADIFLNYVQNENKPMHFIRKIFCYDFNNATNRVRYCPIVRVKDLKKREYSLHYFKHEAPKNVIISDKTFFFEYTFCFKKEAIIRKLQTFAHVSGYGLDAVEYSLNNNISFSSPAKISDKNLQDREFFYKKEELNDENSPMYLRIHAQDWVLNIIPSDYEENRIKNGISPKYKA